MTHAIATTANATDTAIPVSAAELVARFPKCFWYWRPAVVLRSHDDVRLVVRNLRIHGNREAWMAAQQLDQCLSASSRKPS